MRRWAGICLGSASAGISYYLLCRAIGASDAAIALYRATGMDKYRIDALVLGGLATIAFAGMVSMIFFAALCAVGCAEDEEDRK